MATPWKVINMADRNATAEALRDARIQKRQMAADYRWLKKVHRGFWILEHIIRPKRVYVCDDASFIPCEENPTGRHPWLDVHVKIPALSWCQLPRMRFPWVFTVESIYSFCLYKSMDDACTELWSHSNDQEILLHKLTNPVDFWQMVNPKLKTILRNPIVEFDTVWTNEEDFGKDELVKYAGLWLQKFYPNLANRVERVDVTET